MEADEINEGFNPELLASSNNLVGARGKYNELSEDEEEDLRHRG